MNHEGETTVSVLLVDDEPHFADLVAERLTDGGGGLRAAIETDPGSAIERLETGEFDCVISDYDMTGTDGLELLESVRERWPDLPYVLFTGKGSEDIASEAISAGVTEYMQKTTDPDQFRVLRNRVENAVERYRTERELERAETRYRRLVEQNLTGIYIIQDAIVVYANPKVAEIFGYEREEVEGTPVWDLVAESDHGLVEEMIRKRKTGEAREVNYTTTGVRKDGEHFELEVHSSRITYEGEPALIGTLVDVSDRNRRERDLQEYRELFETVGDPMYVLDDSGRFEKVNSAMGELLGYDPDELVGQHATVILPEQDVEAGEGIIRSFVVGDEEPPQTVEVEFVTADDGRIPCEANLAVLTDDDGEFRGSVGVVRVIAERKARERELTQYETIVETAPDGVFIIDEEGTIVNGNRTGANLLGWDREEAIGKRGVDLAEAGIFPDGFVHRYVETVQELLDGETDRRKGRLETTVDPVDDDERTCELHIAPLLGDDGEFRGSVGVIRDVTERKNIETALRTERDRLSALFENIPEPTIVYEYRDGDPVVVQINDAFAETFGYDEPTILGESVDEYVVPPDQNEEAKDLNERVMAGERLDVEIERVTADGERRTFLLRNAPIPTKEGPPQGYAIYTDITERKESEERIQALFRYSTDCIVETQYSDGEPIVQRVNDSFEETFGFDAEEVVGRSIDEITVPERNQPEATEINDHVVGGEPVERGVTRLTADGERDFLLRAIPFDVGEGAWTYGVYTDITERKERERRLSALHSATRQLMEATSREEVAEIGIDAASSVLGLEVACMYCLEDGRSKLGPMVCTERARDLFDGLPTFQKGEGLAWEVFESGDPLITDDVRSEAAVYNPETPARSEMLLPVGDRFLFVASSTEVGAFDDSDRTLAMVLASNVEAAMERAERETLLREREQALLRQNERLDKFATFVSHDLMSPLTVAKGNAYLLGQSLAEDGEDGDLASADDVDPAVAEDADLAGEDAEVDVTGNGDHDAPEDSDHDAPGAAQHLDKIEAALDRMEQLIEDLLTLARQGDTVDVVDRVDTGEVAADAWESVDTAAATLEVGAVDDVVADGQRLQQLLENLFRNAVEHGGSDVTVRVGPLENGLYVADDGEGIPADEREDLFETGYSTHEDGTGLGLAIVDEIAEAHGWSVAVTESAEGGARFEFTGMEPVDVAAEH